jgi:hypothetical protein
MTMWMLAYLAFGALTFVAAYSWNDHRVLSVLSGIAAIACLAYAIFSATPGERTYITLDVKHEQAEE